MIRHAAGAMNGSQVSTLQTAIAARLQADLDAGEIRAVTRNHVRAATTTELSRVK
jgi:hypothetical protein